MGRTGEGYTQGEPCPCGRWHWRPIVAGAGVHMVERHCPRCCREWLLVYRGRRFLGCRPLADRHPYTVEAALQRVRDLTGAELEALMQLAEARAREKAG